MLRVPQAALLMTASDCPRTALRWPLSGSGCSGLQVGRLVDDLVKRRLAEATGQSPGSALRPVKQPALNLSAAALSRSAGIAAHGSRPCSPGRTCSPSLDELSENSLSFTQQ